MADRQMVSVDAKALRTILEALNGPGHHIREIQMTRGIAALTGDDPIGTLIEDYNLAVVGGGPPRCKHCAGTGYEPAPGVSVAPPEGSEPSPTDERKDDTALRTLSRLSDEMGEEL